MPLKRGRRKVLMEAVFRPARRRACIVAREGWVFIFSFGLLAFLFMLFKVWYVGLPLFVLTVFTVFFFRNPERVPPEGTNLLISPADGKVIAVSRVDNNPYTNVSAKKVSIFMSVFNVHVNRIPLAGAIKDVNYYPGKFLIASRDKASLDNERNAIILDAGMSIPVAVVQIAGTVARRIVCYLKKGDSVGCGQRLGLIRFGSRVDLYLPDEIEVGVSVGDKVKAGQSILGRF